MRVPGLRSFLSLGSSLRLSDSNRKSVTRSEERRVGKECRSLCDWSSDVCSSDLAESVTVRDDARAGLEVFPQLGQQPAVERLEQKKRDQIGRASCRERV